MIRFGPDFRLPPQLDVFSLLTLILVLDLLLKRIDRNKDRLFGVIDIDATYTLTSWWRSPERNVQVGGSPNSLHLVGRAIDVVPDTSFFSPGSDATERAAIASTWRRLGQPFQAVDEGDHVHLELDLS